MKDQFNNPLPDAMIPRAERNPTDIPSSPLVEASQRRRDFWLVLLGVVSALLVVWLVVAWIQHTANTSYMRGIVIWLSLIGLFVSPPEAS